MGMLLNMNCFIIWQIEYHDKSFTNDNYLLLYISGKGTMGNGTFQNVSGETWHFKMFQGRRYISIIWETGHSIIWESDHLSTEKHPLGIGNLRDGFQPFKIYIYIFFFFFFSKILHSMACYAGTIPVFFPVYMNGFQWTYLIFLTCHFPCRSLLVSKTLYLSIVYILK